MHSRGKLLTAAVVSEGGTANGVQPAVFGYVDWLNIMAYDGGSPHANYDWSINASTSGRRAACRPARRCSACRSTAVPATTPTPSWSAMDPANANRDCATVSGAQQCYNGIPTIKRKTQWAMANAGGIMNWELSQDTTGSTSLVSAIYDDRRWAARTPPTGGRTGPITGIAGKCVDVAAASTANGTAVQLYDLQRHHRADLDGRPPTARSGRWASAWTSPAAGTANGTKIQLWDCNGTGAQVWQAQSNGTLRNPAVGQVPGRDRPQLRRRHPAADLGLLRRRQPALAAAGLIQRRSGPTAR